METTKKCWNCGETYTTSMRFVHPHKTYGKSGAWYACEATGAAKVVRDNALRGVAPKVVR